MFNRKCKPRSWVPSMYFTQGLPAAIIMQLSVIMYKQMGLSNSLSALFSSLLILPWIAKIFIAPFVERHFSKKLWVILMQLGFITSVALFIASFSLNSPLLISSVCLVILGFCSATYDIASDGIYLQVLDEKQQAFYVGIKTFCYHSANLVTKTGVLWLVGLLSVHYTLQGAWQISLLPVLIGFVLFATINVITIPNDDVKCKNTESFFGIIKQASNIPNLLWVLGFVLLFQAPFYMVHKVAPLFFMDSVSQGGLNLPMSKVAALYETVAN